MLLYMIINKLQKKSALTSYKLNTFMDEILKRVAHCLICCKEFGKCSIVHLFIHTSFGFIDKNFQSDLFRKA